MNYLKKLLSIAWLCCLLDLIRAKALNITVWETENDLLALDRIYNQLETLKVNNGILKLRLEMIELQIGKLDNNVAEIDRKLDNIDSSLQRLHLGQRSQPELQSTPQKDAPAVNKINNGLVSAEHINSVVVSVGEVPAAKAPTLTTSNIEQKAPNNSTESKGMFTTEINGKIKLCNSHTDDTLLCSDMMPTISCASPSSKACLENKCYIKNRLVNDWKPFMVSCNNTVDGGGWTVIQRRINGSVDFYRNWSDYKNGFGDLDGEFWLGLDKLHALTTEFAPVELYVELVDFDDVVKYAKYDSFKVDDEASEYTLSSLGSYTGTAGDSLRYHKNHKFTTKDRDNDNYSGNCADLRNAGWWFNNCSECNLNGLYFVAGTMPKPGNRNGVSWYSYHDSDYSMKFVQMMIRPRK